MVDKILKELLKLRTYFKLSMIKNEIPVFQYKSLEEMPTEVLIKNIEFGKNAMKKWGVCAATDSLLDVVNDWKKEIERREKHVLIN